jgi:hypothetical protein
MQRTAIVTVLVAALAVPLCADAMGKRKNGDRPDPHSCPTDVATSIATTCPCAGQTLPDGSLEPWRNHGQYVRCVVQNVNQLRRAKCLDGSARKGLKRCAARSTCGTTRVVCCLATATCDDAAPNDGVPGGVCSNDPSAPCDRAADCPGARARMARNDQECAQRGGIGVGEGSVCTACLPPTTTTTTTSTTTTTTTP